MEKIDRCPLCKGDLNIALARGGNKEGIIVYYCIKCGKEIPFSKEYAKMIQETDYSLKKII